MGGTFSRRLSYGYSHTTGYSSFQRVFSFQVSWMSYFNNSNKLYLAVFHRFCYWRVKCCICVSGFIHLSWITFLHISKSVSHDEVHVWHISGDDKRCSDDAIDYHAGETGPLPSWSKCLPHLQAQSMVVVGFKSSGESHCRQTCKIQTSQLWSNNSN